MCGYCIEANFVIGRMWHNGVLTAEISGEEADWLLLQMLLEVAELHSLKPCWREQAEKLSPELLQLRHQEAKPRTLALADILADSYAAAAKRRAILQPSSLAAYRQLHIHITTSLSNHPVH